MNLDYNWWGSNDGPKASYFQNNFVPETWLVAKQNVSYYRISDVYKINVSTIFCIYNKTSDVISNLNNNLFKRPVLYNFNGDDVVIENITGISISFDLSKYVIKSVVDNQELWYVTDSFTALQDLINQVDSSKSIVLIPVSSESVYETTSLVTDSST